MKRLALILAIVMSVSSAVHGRSISNIESDGAWYHIYDADGKQYKLISLTEAGELKGYSDMLIIFQKGQFYLIYDSDMKRQGQVAVPASGVILNVSHDTFTTKKDNCILTFSKTGKLLNRR